MSTQPAPPATPRNTGAERTRRWRERMRAKGLAPRTVWTRDLKDPAFLARLKADCDRLGRSAHEAQVTRELEKMAEEDGLWGGVDPWSPEPPSSFPS